MALLLDYTSGESAFCAADSGCGAIRSSGFGFLPLPGGALLPVPVLGIVAFAGLFAASLLRDPIQRKKMVTPMAYAFGAVGLGLFFLQAILGHFCSLCVIVDSSSLISGLSAFALSRREGYQRSAQDEQTDEPADNAFVLAGFAWLSLSSLAILAPLLFPHVVRSSEVPAVIRAMYESDKVSVVEFFDYQCPHCRDLSPRLKEMVRRDGEAVLRFGYSPLPGHELAFEGARVTICSGEQGKEGEVADLFFQTLDLSLDNLRQLAEGVVPDKAALSACLSSERPKQRIDEDTRRLTEAGFEGLPTTYIGGTRIVGALDNPVYLDAIRRAKDGSDTKGLNPWVYWMAIFAAFLGIIVAGRREPKSKSKVKP